MEWLEEHAIPRIGSRFDNDLAIIGEPGIGKTALVAAFLKRNVETIPAVWFDCASWDSARPEFRNIFDRHEIEMEWRRSRRSSGITVVLDGTNQLNERRLEDFYSGVRNWKIVGQVITTSRSMPQLRIREENRRKLSRLDKREIDRLIREKISLVDLDENETLRLMTAINGRPWTLDKNG